MLHFTKRHEQPNSALYHGSMESVARGHIDPEEKRRWIDASLIKYGFLAGSPHGVNSIGELVVANHLAFATCTDQTSFRYFQPITGPRFVAAALLALPTQSDHNWQVEWKAQSQHPTLKAIASEVYAKIKAPLMLAARATFSELKGTALSAPPIDEEPLAEFKDKYQAFPPITERGGEGFIVGVIANVRDEPYSALSRQLYETALCPCGPKNTDGFFCHFHTLTVQGELSSLSRFDPQKVDNVLHLLEETEITELEAELFQITSLNSFFY